VLQGKPRQAEVARLLKPSVHQVRRLQRPLERKAMRELSIGCGAPSNARQDPQKREKIFTTYQRDFADFGPTLAAEDRSQRSCG